MDVRAALRRATTLLADAGVATARTDAELLAAFCLKTTRAEVLKAVALGGATLPEKYWDLVDTRCARIPLQHITGEAPFRDLTLKVGPGVFVPRPETEYVAQAAIDAARAAGPHPLVVDLCTGSGALACAIASEVPDATVYAVELDPMAVGWAELNTAALGVRLRQGDAALAFPELDGSVHVVVSNPPYIPPDMEPVDLEVREHDPPLALYGGGPDGLAVPRAVIARATDLLRTGGTLVMEHADCQGESAMALCDPRTWSEVRDHPDATGRSRYITAVRMADFAS